MKIRTQTGLEGQLIAYREIKEGTDFVDGVAIVKRVNAPDPSRPYSTHIIMDSYPQYNNELSAALGHYDLTLEEAEADFAERSHP